MQYRTGVYREESGQIHERVMHGLVLRFNVPEKYRGTLADMQKVIFSKRVVKGCQYAVGIRNDIL